MAFAAGLAGQRVVNQQKGETGIDKRRVHGLVDVLPATPAALDCRGDKAASISPLCTRLHTPRASGKIGL